MSVSILYEWMCASRIRDRYLFIMKSPINNLEERERERTTCVEDWLKLPMQSPKKNFRRLTATEDL
jgi:hypothetical protein